MRSLWPTGGLWRHPDFLKLWSAETVSQRRSGSGRAGRRAGAWASAKGSGTASKARSDT